MQDRLLKYTQLPQMFYALSSDIEIKTRQSDRACGKLAKFLASNKPKTPLEFERNEYLKEFVIKTSETNESVLRLLDAFKTIIVDVCEDYNDLSQSALRSQTITIQAQTIELLIQQREQAITMLYECQRDKGVIK